MKSALALLSIAGYVAAQGVTSAIAPASSPPAGCSESYSGSFEISVVKASSKRDVHARAACAGTGTLVLTLSNGVLKDAKGRTGYIASNQQFQFDDPPQTGAIYTAGFSVCSDGTLALGGNKTWYECESGTFSNLYDADWAAQCSAADLAIIPCGDSSTTGSGGSGGASVVGTQSVTTTIISSISDGQPQVITTVIPVPMCQVSQIGDGQVQATTTPCASISGAVSEYSDGQPQVTATATAPPISEYSDGQPQVVTSVLPVSEYSDGQPQVVTTSPTRAPVSEYSDGQPQVTSTASATGTGSVFYTSTTSALASSNGTTSSLVPVPTAGAARVGGVGAVVMGLAGAVLAL